MDNQLFKSGLEEEKRPSPPPKKRRKASRVAAPIGAIVLVLSALGLITVVIAAIGFGRSLINNDKEKARFERMLMPVVMYDPPPFENISTLDPAMLLQTAMWSAILNNDDAKWAKNELGFSQIPASELDVRAANLYGPSVKLQHQTFGDYETTYLYDEQTKTYSVPPAAETQMYTPKVEKITKAGDEVTLRVGYVPPGSVWEIDENGNRFEPEPDKYMNYILKKTDTGYMITALRYVEEDTSSTVSQTSSLDEELISSDTSSTEGEVFGDGSSGAGEAVSSGGDTTSVPSSDVSSGDTSSGDESSGEESSSDASSSKSSSSSASSSSRSSSSSGSSSGSSSD